MKLGRFVSVPVMTVLIVVCFVYYATVFVFIEEWLGIESSAGALNALFFTSLASLTLFSLSVCVLTDPGGVPPGFLPDLEQDHHNCRSGSDQEQLHTDNYKNALQLRKCDRCSAYKPPRAHHCRSCQRCILRMDHHCSWINNCVGHRNYKAFFILVLYATIASIYSMISILCCLVQKDWDFGGNASLKLFYIISGVIILGLTFTLGTLLGWHIYLVIHNMTTIEYYGAVRAAWLAKKSGQCYRHPFDVGVYKNISLNKRRSCKDRIIAPKFLILISNGLLDTTLKANTAKRKANIKGNDV